MSLPTTGKPSNAQPSIRSFFQSKTPQYAPPPSSSSAKPTPAPPPPPSPPAPSSTSAQQPSLPTPPSTLPPLPPTLPDEATIRPPTQTDIIPLKRINALLLPVSYTDEFYNATVAPEAAYLSRIITYQHSPAEEAKIVGGVICALEPLPSRGYTLYIRCLCVLSPYRGLGLVGMALENIVNTVRWVEDAQVKIVTAHVWSENEEGLAWYDKQGFRRENMVEGYYRKLRPDSAWLVTRDIDANNPLSPSNGTKTISATPTAAVVNLPPMDNGPPKRPPPRTTSSGQSYQNQKTEMEWNDLPADMAPIPKRGGLSEPVSNASSRSSSAARKKRDRSYPAAAFGSK